MVRIALYEGDEFGGYVECPETATVRTAVRTLVARGWTEIKGTYDGKVRLINGGGNYQATIEDTDIMAVPA